MNSFGSRFQDQQPQHHLETWEKCKLLDTIQTYSEKAMTPHSSTLAWKIPWMEEPGGLQSMGLLRVRHDWATSLSLFTFVHWKRKWHPLRCSCLENPRDGGAWRAAVYGVAQRKRLSSSSSSQTYWIRNSGSQDLFQQVFQVILMHTNVWEPLA